jgi:hypothetical protein
VPWLRFASRRGCQVGPRHGRNAWATP